MLRILASSIVSQFASNHIRQSKHIINLPAVGYNFSDAEPVGWAQANLTAKGGDFTLHAIAGNKDKDGSVTKLLPFLKS